MMKLTMVFMLAAALTVSANTRSQTVSLSGKNLPLLSVFNTVEKQTGYVLFANQNVFEQSRTISVDVKNMPLDAFLKQILKDQPIDFFIKDKTIVLKKKATAASNPAPIVLFEAPAKIPVTGRVTDSTGNPLAGATITLKGKTTITQTDNNGAFTIDADYGDELQISFVGYQYQKHTIKEGKTNFIIKMLPNNIQQEVVVTSYSTGYQKIPKERATGSFEQIDNKLLNRTTGPSILSRLEGIAKGVQFLTPGSNNPVNLRVRGLSTIESNSRPLIVIDNFPYDGNYTDKNNSQNVDLSFINPNDIENITILEDAAAASIWGARAGNGVIVITTKSGKLNQRSRISFNHTSTIGNKPDLFYDQNFLPAEAIMGIEKYRLDTLKMYGPTTNQQVIPEYIALLNKKNSMTPEAFEAELNRLKNTDVRRQIMDNLMQKSLLQQYSLNFSGGGNNYSYYLSAGYDKNRGTLIGNNDERFNISLNNTFVPVKNLTLQAGIAYSHTNSHNNGIGMDELSSVNFIGVSPYMQLRAANGNASAIVKDLRQDYKDQMTGSGFLDWNFRPLDEIGLRDFSATGKELRINASVSYKFLNRFEASVQFQNTTGNNESRTYYKKESYTVRNLVNTFQQKNGTRAFPYGDYLINGVPYKSNANTFRSQLTYNDKFGKDHVVSALAGMEIRETNRESGAASYVYGYNPDIMEGTSRMRWDSSYAINPGGTRLLPGPFPYDLTLFTDRFLSYFVNASYTYKNRYTISGSSRWDGSNLFGVKTNQKWTPLWSVGAKWDVNKEEFYYSTWVPALIVRATYGVAGNSNNLYGQFPVMLLNTDFSTQMLQGKYTSAGNPTLQWEEVKTLNLGVDFTLKNNRISGSIEYYRKISAKLIGNDYFAPSTGIITGGSALNTKKVNYANMRTQGFDFSITSRNLTGELGWNSTVLFSTVKNKVTNVYVNPGQLIYDYFGTPSVPVVGVSRDMIYAAEWNGLDPQTGMPIIYYKGERTTSYKTYLDNLKKDQLKDAGVSVPTFYGSLRNDLSWKNFGLSFLITWKGGHVFRRNSMSPGSEWNNGLYHMDYFKRWAKPGDEAFTNVPAFSKTYDANLSTYYKNSETLITKGDLIRFQDIALSYAFTKRQFPKLPVEKINLIANVRNVGLLYKANDFGIDPDFVNAQYVTPRTFALGIQLDL